MPNSLRRLFNKLRFFARGEKFDADLAEEMAYHRELKQRDIQSADPALTAKDAHHATNREFGNDLYLRDRSRDVVGFWFETTLQDFRFSLRQLRKNLGFTVTAILMLALGMAASVAIFSFVDAALLKPLPYRDPSRLVGVFESITMFKESNLSIPDYLRLEKTQRSLHRARDLHSVMASLCPIKMVSNPSASAASAMDFSASWALRQSSAAILPPAKIYSPLRAPWCSATPPGKSATAAAPTSSANPSSSTKIHTPSSASFRATFISFPPSPPNSGQRCTPRPGCDLRRGCHGMNGVARLKDGVTLQQALANVTSIAQQLEHEYPDSNRDQGAYVTPLSEVHRRRSSPHPLRSPRRRRAPPHHRRRQHRQLASRPRRKPPPRNRRPRRARCFASAFDSPIRHRRARRRFRRHRLRPRPRLRRHARPREPHSRRIHRPHGVLAKSRIQSARSRIRRRNRTSRRDSVLAHAQCPRCRSRDA